jgi:L-iditol 2-dehydrogenase
VVVIGPGRSDYSRWPSRRLGPTGDPGENAQNRRLAIGRELGADRVININDEDAAKIVQLTGGIGADYPVVECAGNEATINQAIHDQSRRKICLAAFPHDPITMDLAHLVKNNIYAYGIRGEGRSATRRAMALMAKSASMRPKSHPHLSARQPADCTPDTPRERIRRCHQRSSSLQPTSDR